MPKATLTFTLPEESEEHEHAINSVKYHQALHEFGEWLRMRAKHGSPQETAEEELEQIRAEFWEIVGGMLG